MTMMPMSVNRSEVVSNTFKPLKKMKFACNSYFSSMSTENDNFSSFFTTSALKCT